MLMLRAYCSLRNEMEGNEMKRNEMERNEMKICSLRNENPLENAEFKFSVNNEGEDAVNKKPGSRRNIA